MFNNLFRDKPELKLDGVKYTSIANNYRGENIAICEDSFIKKLDFVGANFCYTYNINGKVIDNDSTALIGRINAAKLKDDKSFEWVNSENDFDYIVRDKDDYKFLVLPSNGSRFPKAVTRISG